MEIHGSVGRWDDVFEDVLASLGENSRQVFPDD
jgi:hypothetical protein